MASAAERGHEAIVRLCHDEWGAAEAVNYAIAVAAKGGHETIVRLCHDEWGATNSDLAMAKAAHNGHG
jgi:divalent metal cation (Fe/Co/Zn/Cd) transporter